MYIFYFQLRRLPLYGFILFVTDVFKLRLCFALVLDYLTIPQKVTKKLQLLSIVFKSWLQIDYTVLQS